MIFNFILNYILPIFLLADACSDQTFQNIILCLVPSKQQTLLIHSLFTMCITQKWLQNVFEYSTLGIHQRIINVSISKTNCIWLLWKIKITSNSILYDISILTPGNYFFLFKKIHTCTPYQDYSHSYFLLSPSNFYSISPKFIAFSYITYINI